MKPLSSCLHPDTISVLKTEIAKNRFPGVSFEQAMQFILTDGLFPSDDLPVDSFLRLEDWARAHDEETHFVSFTASELKNKTGEVLEKVLQGKTVRLLKHGRQIAEIRKI